MPDLTVRILLDGKLVATHRVATRPSAVEDAHLAARGDALRNAIQAGELTIAEALRATIEIIDAGNEPSPPEGQLPTPSG